MLKRLLLVLTIVVLTVGFVIPSITKASAESSYGMDSYVVQRVGGRVLANYNGYEHPAAPASTLKLILVDLALRGNSNLSSQIKIERKHLYGCGYDGNYRVGQKIRFRTAITRALRNSDNVAANTLIDFGGGLAVMNARAYGGDPGRAYYGTKINNYYSCSGNSNTTTAIDISRAMSILFTTKGSGYNNARSALRAAAHVNNYWGVGSAYANKYGSTSVVSGNCAIIKHGRNKFIVTVYVNRANAGPQIRSASAALADLGARLN